MLKSINKLFISILFIGAFLLNTPAYAVELFTEVAELPKQMETSFERSLSGDYVVSWDLSGNLQYFNIKTGNYQEYYSGSVLGIVGIKTANEETLVAGKYYNMFTGESGFFYHTPYSQFIKIPEDNGTVIDVLADKRLLVNVEGEALNEDKLYIYTPVQHPDGSYTFDKTPVPGMEGSSCPPNSCVQGNSMLEKDAKLFILGSAWKDPSAAEEKYTFTYKLGDPKLEIVTEPDDGISYPQVFSSDGIAIGAWRKGYDGKYAGAQVVFYQKEQYAPKPQWLLIPGVYDVSYSETSPYGSFSATVFANNRGMVAFTGNHEPLGAPQAYTFIPQIGEVKNVNDLTKITLPNGVIKATLDLSNKYMLVVANLQQNKGDYGPFFALTLADF